MAPSTRSSPHNRHVGCWNMATVAKYQYTSNRNKYIYSVEPAGRPLVFPIRYNLGTSRKLRKEKKTKKAYSYLKGRQRASKISVFADVCRQQNYIPSTRLTRFTLQLTPSLKHHHVYCVCLNHNRKTQIARQFGRENRK